MVEGPETGMRSVLLIWIIGLALGVAAGAATAMLMMPGSAHSKASREVVSDHPGN